MQEGTIGRRYARALADSIDAASSGNASSGSVASGSTADALAKTDAELGALGLLMENKTSDFRQAMMNPSFQAKDRQAILDAIVKGNSFSAATDVFLRLIVQKDRLPYLALIARCFTTEVDERLGRVRAQITSAKTLHDDAMKAIVTSLEKRTGKTVLPETIVDASVISGVSARIGGLVFDGTLRSQLDRLRVEMR